MSSLRYRDISMEGQLRASVPVNGTRSPFSFNMDDLVLRATLLGGGGVPRQTYVLVAFMQVVRIETVHNEGTQ